MQFEKGCLARSKAGHDINCIYVVIGTDEHYVYVSDGKLKADKPKRKNPRHLQPIRFEDEMIANRLKDGEAIQNSDIRHALNQYKIKHKATIQEEKDV